MFAIEVYRLQHAGLTIWNVSGSSDNKYDLTLVGLRVIYRDTNSIYKNLILKCI